MLNSIKKGGLFRILLIGLLIIVAFLVSSVLGQIGTFLVFDILLTFYLISFFKHKWKYLFLLHPLIIYLTSLGFEIRYEDIGVGYTYLNSYSFFIDLSNYTSNSAELSESIFNIKNGLFGFKNSYIGVLPFFLVPNLLFENKLDGLTLYFSISNWTLICAIIATYFSKKIKSISEKTLLVAMLIIVISPTFIEINSSIHRYHLLVLGLFLFYISWNAIRLKRNNTKLYSYLALVISILLIGISKAAIFFSLILFVFIDYTINRNLNILRNSNRSIIYLLLIVIVALIQIFGSVILPENYTVKDFNTGATNIFTQLPIIGFFVRIIYASLAPFPWITFNQWQLYGYNEMFLIIHILSAILVLWLVLSLFLHLKPILFLKYEHRSSIIMGLCIIFSLSFSAVGHHVYIAPAVPFLSVLFLNRALLTKISYPIFAIIFGEILMFFI